MEPSKETKDKWHQDPSNWIWGIFYYNKEDERILPPKRIKQLGWTINFANPNSVFFLVILLIVLFILSKRI
jgi:uncharacterized membrane protein